METGAKNKKLNSATVISVIAVIIIGFGGYKHYSLGKEHQETIALFTQQKTEYESKISNLELERTSLTDALTSEQAKNEEFEDQIREISGTIGTLEKLSKTDPELLKKYSKVAFLNENYAPAKLKNIADKYLFNVSDDQFVQTDTNFFLERLLDAAKRANHDIRVASGYRSFTSQATLKSNYKVIYGAGTANQFSADQGYSEHQLGTAFDFAEADDTRGIDGFAQTESFKWMRENAHKYGFVLSYPEGNAYYQYEPWHWRFVGIKLARELNDEDMNFYDMDQREIDKYLINIFDRN